MKRCKSVPTVTILCKRTFAHTNVGAKPFYKQKNQHTQILNFLNPV